MIKLIVLPSLLLITSCELVDYKMPEIPEHEKDGAEEDIQAETIVTKVPKEITQRQFLEYFGYEYFEKEINFFDNIICWIYSNYICYAIFT